MVYALTPITNAQNQLMVTISHIPLRELMCWYEEFFKALEVKKIQQYLEALVFLP
jgi:hypothetical protein